MLKRINYYEFENNSVETSASDLVAVVDGACVVNHGLRGTCCSCSEVGPSPRSKCVAGHQSLLCFGAPIVAPSCLIVVVVVVVFLTVSLMLLADVHLARISRVRQAEFVFPFSYRRQAALVCVPDS